MSTQTPASVRVTRHFDATAERVFDAWLDPVRVGKWLFATSTGRMVRVELDARVGGTFLFVDRRNGEDIEHHGEYLEISRPKRLVFRFVVPKLSPNYTRVAIDIVAAASGCDLTLLHEGVLPAQEQRVHSGWQSILDALGACLSTALGA
jgi:uncharacterized protein YndB with AHSA1/START domain